MVVLNTHREVANFVNATQFVGGHSEFACGPFAASHVKWTTQPDKPNNFSQGDVQHDGFRLYAKYLGPDTPQDTGGSSIDNMHSFYHDLGYHYWDIASINSQSNHEDDIRRIKAMLSAGYPGVGTIEECSAYDVALGRNPYWWGCSGNHVVCFSGIAASGNVLVQDTANVIGPLQGDNWERPGPREYDASKIRVSYMSVIQLGWLKTIPGDDPLTWPANFDAQEFGQPPPPPPVDGFPRSMADMWKAFRLDVPTGTGIYGSWLQEAKQQIWYGPPLTKEMQTVNIANEPVIKQWFAYGWCEWKKGVPHWYGGVRGYPAV